MQQRYIYLLWLILALIGLAASFTCTPQLPNCADCMSDQQTCQTCNPGYFVPSQLTNGVQFYPCGVAYCALCSV